MSGLKTATFTVHGTVEQSARWKRVAEAEGFPSVGGWLARAADAYLKARARAGNPIPLCWHRGRFRVVLMDGREVEVYGVVSPPFGYFQGSGNGPNRNKPRTLVHIPTARIIATLKRARQAYTLASELAPVYARDDAATAGIVERHRRESF